MNKIEVGRASIQRRIVNGFFATTTLALLLTAGALFTTALLQFRQDMDQNLQVLARVTAANTEASLLFDDNQTALETLRVPAMDGELPRDVRRVVRTLQGIAISVNVNEGIHVLVALMFGDPDAADRARRHLDAIRDEFGPKLRDLGPWGDAVLRAMAVEQDDRFVTVLVELEPDVARQAIAAAGHLAGAR